MIREYWAPGDVLYYIINIMPLFQYKFSRQREINQNEEWAGLHIHYMSVINDRGMQC